MLCLNLGTTRRLPMSFIRHKKIHDQIYAYEVTGYRDEITKKIRQKVKYIGPVDENVI